MFNIEKLKNAEFPFPHERPGVEDLNVDNCI